MSPLSLMQKTLRTSIKIQGVGIHTGEVGSVEIRPALEGSGLRFFRNGRAIAEACPSGDSVEDAPSLRCSSIGGGSDRILTVEHLLAALSGLGITNAELHVDGPEIPALDGSALPFVEAIKKAGVVEQAARADHYQVREPIFCYDGSKSIAIYPSEEFSAGYVLDYDHPHLKDQKVEFVLGNGVFENQIAPARTFCTQKEAEHLQKSGFGRGATQDNTLVVRDDGSHANHMRFPDECARHKVLDMIGDLALLGFPVRGRVVGIRSGHRLNQMLVRAILQEKDKQ